MKHVTNAEELQLAVRQVAHGETILVNSGDYQVHPSEPVDIANQDCGGAALQLIGKDGVTIQGAGDPVLQSFEHGSILGIQDCHSIRVHGLQFSGNGLITEPKPYYFALLYLAGENRFFSMRDCSFFNGGNHGIGHLLDGETSDSVFEDLWFDTGGSLAHPTLQGDGAAIACGGNNNTYSRIWVHQWLRGLEWETKYDHPTRGNIARDCRFNQCMWQAIYVDPSHGKPELFTDNSIVDCIIRGIGKPYNGKWKSQHGIRLNGGTNWRISGCVISDLFDECGIAAELRTDLTDGIIEGNRIYDCGRTGIRLEQTAGKVIKRILVRGNMVGPVGGQGIFLDGTDLSCQGNYIRETGPDGARWEAIFAKDESGLTTIDYKNGTNMMRDTKETESAPA